MSKNEINVIGAGLAGCEAAWQLAKVGFKVKLYEKKKKNKNEIQKLDTFCELVCSNTLRSISTQNAVGILKQELKLLNSFILECAYKTQIPSDDALAVDREKFSQLVENKIRNNSNIEVIEDEFLDLNNENVTLIATGPLCSEEFKFKIEQLLGKQKLFYLDASAPIIEKESIDFSKVYYQSRHKNDKSYICIPLNEEQFNNFHKELINAQKVEVKDFEKEIFFRGCQPIEQLARVSKKILLKSVMSPNGLTNSKGEIPFAVVQLRRDDALDNLYNIVGFQTNLTWKEQKRIFSMLPGLENAIFRRFGVMHKNNFINSPKILNKKLQMMRKKNIFFAGQITGVEGYIESFATGLVSAYGIISYLNQKKFINFPEESIIGSLVNYITNPNIKKLKPMKANMGLVEIDKKLIFNNKFEKNEFIYKEAIKKIKYFINSNK
ncbi:methylenetetrahydrofolate--tRNA-(uracil(54)-C(5))-methyltransferase (FADH(2)-oxidizing) TrmFO [Spiroplasma taiwanense]|uniref:Methylenetetrahydrofolate--tRNA-(uracil-5-)-methyltransferase TrmFO n=1 Tax=Spiroplasma taiwanense CT-1 TaxID=1276220 RepID=S5LY22_9MOLU|nr:methylenetetrahydrofolate--tRNA-(uracil(54)-C(5))-methyltransferase (FADH(2)-oxidizing) TrmFO [Spiroplasma taiwanense]AGR41501.1 tRNA (uracil-5-)-methyltransferase Gid [Spiroplasma taiwanense CT-1]